MLSELQPFERANFDLGHLVKIVPIRYLKKTAEICVTECEYFPVSYFFVKLNITQTHHSHRSHDLSNLKDTKIPRFGPYD